MKAQHILSTRNLAVFINFVSYPLMSMFRIIEDGKICRVILNQKIVVGSGKFESFQNLPSMMLLAVTCVTCGDISYYKKEEQVAIFFRLRRRRYWIPGSIWGQDEILTEWAEYETDDYEIDFAKFANSFHYERAAH